MCPFTRSFNLLSESIPGELGDKPGWEAGEKTVNDQRYSDDTALKAESKKDLQNTLSVVMNQSGKKELRTWN